MLTSISSEIIFIAPIHEDRRFVEFRISTKSRCGSSWVFMRHVVDDVPADYRHLVSKIPVNAPYQAEVPFHLKNITVIDSRPPASTRTADIAGDPYFDLLSPLLRDLGVGHVYVATDSATSITENAQSFSASGTVIILGGDTSVHEFINALPKSMNCELRLAVIPTGTGNALSISSGMETPTAAVRKLFLSESCDFVPLSTLPVFFPGLAEQRAIVVASWGMHSALVCDSSTDEMRKKFKDEPNEKFKEAARINLDTILQKYYGDVFTNGEHVFGPEHSYLLFTLVTHLEAGFLISPDSNPPSDKYVHMIGIKPFTMETQRKELMEIMQEVYDNGKHVKDPRVTYSKFEDTVQVRVDGNQEARMRRWCIDGRTVVAEPGTVELGRPTSEYRGWTLKVLSNKR